VDEIEKKTERRVEFRGLGRPKKVAQIAVARKLLRQAHAIYRTKRPFHGTPQKTALADLARFVGEIEAGDESRGLDMAYSI